MAFLHDIGLGDVVGLIGQVLHPVLLLKRFVEGLVVLALPLAVEEQTVVGVHELVLLDRASSFVVVRVGHSGPYACRAQSPAAHEALLPILLLD